MAVDRVSARRAQWYAVLLIIGAMGIVYGAWRWLGTAGIVLSSPLLGLALARPLLAGLSFAHQVTKTRALQSVQGRYFAHRGHTIDIAEDADRYRWLRTDDVRKVVPGLPGDAVLQRLFPEGVACWSPADSHRIKAEALLKYLEKATDPASLKFKHWIVAEVVLPAGKRRAS
jgi:hypothetical protein